MDGSTPSPLTPSTLLLRSVAREHGFEPLRVEGTVPAGLAGTLYRVGPGALETFGVPHSHLFEADGAVTAIRIGPDGAAGAIRLVESEGRREERRAGKPLYGFHAPYLTRMRRTLGGKYKNLANTAPMLFQGRLLAMCEAFRPMELDPETLETIGETTLEGAVRGAFSAHPHRVAERAATYNFGVRYGRTTFLDCYELPDVGAARRLASIPLPRPVMLHDFAATRKHLLFFVSPFEVDVKRALLGLGPFGKMFVYRPEHGTEVIVVPIDDPGRIRRFRTDAFFQWHFANAYEDDAGLVVDFVRYPDTWTFDHIGEDVALGGELVRVRVDPGAGPLRTERAIGGCFEFPSVDVRFAGEASRFVYTTTEAADHRGVARHDMVTGTTDAFHDGVETWYAEPVFAPDPARGREGGGWLLSLVLDARRGTSHLAVFDAEAPSRGPLAKLAFDEALPITFHGTFRPAAGG